MYHFVQAGKWNAEERSMMMQAYQKRPKNNTVSIHVGSDSINFLTSPMKICFIIHEPSDSL